MPRSITPRQPGKSGRHEGTGKAASSKKPGVLRTPRTGKSARPYMISPHNVVCVVGYSGFRHNHFDPLKPTPGLNVPPVPYVR